MSEKTEKKYTHGEIVFWSFVIFFLSAFFFGGFFGGVIAGASYVWLRGNHMKKVG
jgi:hypothetical protein